MKRWLAFCAQVHRSADRGAGELIACVWNTPTGFRVFTLAILLFPLIVLWGVEWATRWAHPIRRKALEVVRLVGLHGPLTFEAILRCLSFANASEVDKTFCYIRDHWLLDSRKAGMWDSHNPWEGTEWRPR